MSTMSARENKHRASMKRANIKLAIFVVLAAVCIAFACKTTPIFNTLLFASLDIQVSSNQGREYADNVYLGEQGARQELYNSKDGYTRWFSYSMGQNSFLRALSVALYLAQVAGAVIFPLLCIMVSINMVKEMARYQKYRATRRAAR